MRFPILIIATALIGVILSLGVVSRVEGIILIVIFACQFAYQILYTVESVESEIEETPSKSLPLEFSWILTSIVLLFLGADFLLQGATVVAQIVGISERVIALSMVSIGTSLPELASVLVASRKGYFTISLGTVIGSNIFNTLFITGAAALVRPISYSQEIFTTDFVALSILTLLLLVEMFCVRTLSRKIGVFNLLVYFFYMAIFVF